MYEHILILEDKYSYLINGEAATQIDEYLTAQHTFEEYCEVSDSF